MYKKFLLVVNIVFVIGTGNVSASCEDPLDPTPCEIDDPVPIDEEVLFLLVAGALYGVKKIKENRKKKAMLILHN